MLSQTLDIFGSFLRDKATLFDVMILGGDLNSQLGSMISGANDCVVGEAAFGSPDERALEIIAFLQEWKLFAASTCRREGG